MWAPKPQALVAARTSSYSGSACGAAFIPRLVSHLCFERPPTVFSVTSCAFSLLPHPCPPHWMNKTFRNIFLLSAVSPPIPHGVPLLFRATSLHPTVLLSHLLQGPLISILPYDCHLPNLSSWPLTIYRESDTPTALPEISGLSSAPSTDH